jgi:hypothetical protein
VTSIDLTAVRAVTTSARLRLRVAPGARRNEVVGRLGDVWKLRVCSAPERGAANSDVVALLAEVLDVDARALRIVAGQASRDKVVAVDGVSLDEAERRLASGGRT